MGFVISTDALSRSLGSLVVQGHHSETRTLTLIVAAEGQFIFNLLEPAKPAFGVGEYPTIKYGVRNVGGVTATATIRVYDNESGSLLETWRQYNVPPGESYGSSAAVIHQGMPDHDWVIRFEVTP